MQTVSQTTWSLRGCSITWPALSVPTSNMNQSQSADQFHSLQQLRELSDCLLFFSNRIKKGHALFLLQLSALQLQPLLDLLIQISLDRHLFYSCFLAVSSLFAAMIGTGEEQRRRWNSCQDCSWCRPEIRSAGWDTCSVVVL